MIWFLAPKGENLYIFGRMSYQDIITIEPDKRGGKPCIRGMRITVYDALEYLASGMTQEQILEDFPELTTADIRACTQRRTVSSSFRRIPTFTNEAFSMVIRPS